MTDIESKLLQFEKIINNTTPISLQMMQFLKDENFIKEAKLYNDVILNLLNESKVLTHLNHYQKFYDYMCKIHSFNNNKIIVKPLDKKKAVATATKIINELADKKFGTHKPRLTVKSQFNNSLLIIDKYHKTAAITATISIEKNEEQKTSFPVTFTWNLLETAELIKCYEYKIVVTKAAKITQPVKRLNQRKVVAVITKIMDELASETFGTNNKLTVKSQFDPLLKDQNEKKASITATVIIKKDRKEIIRFALKFTSTLLEVKELVNYNNFKNALIRAATITEPVVTLDQAKAVDVATKIIDELACKTFSTNSKLTVKSQFDLLSTGKYNKTFIITAEVKVIKNLSTFISFPVTFTWPLLDAKCREYKEAIITAATITEPVAIIDETTAIDAANKIIDELTYKTFGTNNQLMIDSEFGTLSTDKDDNTASITVTIIVKKDEREVIRFIPTFTWNLLRASELTKCHEYKEAITNKAAIMQPLKSLKQKKVVAATIKIIDELADEKFGTDKPKLSVNSQFHSLVTNKDHKTANIIITVIVKEDKREVFRFTPTFTWSLLKASELTKCHEYKEAVTKAATITEPVVTPDWKTAVDEATKIINELADKKFGIYKSRLSVNSEFERTLPKRDEYNKTISINAIVIINKDSRKVTSFLVTFTWILLETKCHEYKEAVTKAATITEPVVTPDLKTAVDEATKIINELADKKFGIYKSKLSINSEFGTLSTDKDDNTASITATIIVKKDEWKVIRFTPTFTWNLLDISELNKCHEYKVAVTRAARIIQPVKSLNQRKIVAAITKIMDELASETFGTNSKLTVKPQFDPLLKDKNKKNATITVTVIIKKDGRQVTSFLVTFTWTLLKARALTKYHEYKEAVIIAAINNEPVVTLEQAIAVDAANKIINELAKKFGINNRKTKVDSQFDTLSKTINHKTVSINAMVIINEDENQIASFMVTFTWNLLEANELTKYHEYKEAVITAALATEPLVKTLNRTKAVDEAAKIINNLADEKFGTDKPKLTINPQFYLFLNKGHKIARLSAIVIIKKNRRKVTSFLVTFTWNLLEASTLTKYHEYKEAVIRAAANTVPIAKIIESVPVMAKKIINNLADEKFGTDKPKLTVKSKFNTLSETIDYKTARISAIVIIKKDERKITSFLVTFTWNLLEDTELTKYYEYKEAVIRAATITEPVASNLNQEKAVAVGKKIINNLADEKFGTDKPKLSVNSQFNTLSKTIDYKTARISAIVIIKKDERKITSFLVKFTWNLLGANELTKYHEYKEAVITAATNNEPVVTLDQAKAVAVGKKIINNLADEKFDKNKLKLMVNSHFDALSNQDNKTATINATVIIKKDGRQITSFLVTFTWNLLEDTELTKYHEYKDAVIKAAKLIQPIEGLDEAFIYEQKIINLFEKIADSNSKKIINDNIVWFQLQKIFVSFFNHFFSNPTNSTKGNLLILQQLTDYYKKLTKLYMKNDEINSHENEYHNEIFNQAINTVVVELSKFNNNYKPKNYCPYNLFNMPKTKLDSSWEELKKLLIQNWTTNKEKDPQFESWLVKINEYLFFMIIEKIHQISVMDSKQLINPDKLKNEIRDCWFTDLEIMKMFYYLASTSYFIEKPILFSAIKEKEIKKLEKQ